MQYPAGKGPDMEDRPHTAEDAETTPEGSPIQDIAVILSQLPRSGSEDDIARLMDVYEAGERRYRASIQASAPTVRASASTSL